MTDRLASHGGMGPSFHVGEHADATHADPLMPPEKVAPTVPRIADITHRNGVDLILELDPLIDDPDVLLDVSNKIATTSGVGVGYEAVKGIREYMSPDPSASGPSIPVGRILKRPIGNFTPEEWEARGLGTEIQEDIAELVLRFPEDTNIDKAKKVVAEVIESQQLGSASYVFGDQHLNTGVQVEAENARQILAQAYIQETYGSVQTPQPDEGSGPASV